MKIVCDSCSAKYSIADEKVAGKVFKIRCKKCSNVIVVRGDSMESGGAHEDASQAFDYGGDAAWHLVLDGEQQGPFTAAQVAGMLSEGSIDYESYVWKEGFDGWKTLNDVPELMATLGGADGGGDGSMNEESDSGTGAADPFAASATSGAGLFASSGGSANANDLFASSSGGSLFESADDVVASKPSPRVSTSDAMTGQRNENSVLFSLSNLQALASTNDSGQKGGGPLRGAAPAARGGFPSGPGMAAGEGSGLIDIRALASATAATGASATKSAGSPVDDLLAIGMGPSIGSSLGAPILAPVAPEPVAVAAPAPQGGGSNKLLLIAAVVAVLAALAAVAYAFTRPPEIQVVTQPAVTPPGAPVPTDTTGTPPTGAEPAGAATPPDTVPTSTGETTPSMPAPPPSASGSDTASSAGRRPGSTSTTAAPEGTTRPPEPATMVATASPTTTMQAPTPSATSTMESSMSASLDDLIGMAVAQMTEESADLPDTPSRSAVSSALGGRAAAVRACGNGATGTATVAVTFASNGRVTSANVAGGAFAGNSCIANAVRGARVPPFRQPSFNVNFPYRL